MVYAMLMEASESSDPARFRESELYRRCAAAGVVPATEADLARINQTSADAEPLPEAVGSETETLMLQFKVAGMWCPACAWVIETALGRRPGVREAVCDFATDRLRCRYDPTFVDPDTIKGVVRNLGYTPEVPGETAQNARQRGEFIRLILCALLSMNVMMLSWALYSGFFTSLSSDDIRHISWPILVMATVVMIYGGGPLFRKAWWGLRAAAPGMETLVCLGAGSAYLYSICNFAAGSWHLYFDTAATLITLVLLGKTLEARAKARVRNDLEGFLALQPHKVRLCSPKFPQGRFADIAQLKPGDAFRVQTEEIVAADGRILAGRGWVDEAAVTGESRPRAVAPGDPVTSGTHLLKGDVTVMTQRVGRDAMIGQMIAIIEAGLGRRTPLESRTDRWLALFVPLMAGLAGATVIIAHGVGSSWEQAFVRGLTVLVIACPCALGIAIPMARIAGISGAGRKGILVRDFEAFERSIRADTVVFDKTGTLTQGRWRLERVEALPGFSADEAAALAAGLEKEADHAIARAVTAYARQQGLAPAPVEKIQIHPSGIEGWFEGRYVRIGSWAFVTQGAPPTLDNVPDALFSRVFLSINRQIAAHLWFGDQVRQSAKLLVRQLAADGYRVYLISGDAHDTTAAVAQRLGIAEAQGGLSPMDKAEFVTRLQQAGRRVIMVGDGLNDAPALARSDLSVALHRDAALTQQAASLTLMRGDPAQLLDFLGLAGQVNARVAQNLACAWIYNLVGIPIAMSGWLNPLVAVLAMLLSSLTVIGNTLRPIKK